MSGILPWLETAFLWLAAALSAVYVLQGKRPMQNAMISTIFLLLALERIMTMTPGH
jgi:hypothetical protein